MMSCQRSRSIDHLLSSTHNIQYTIKHTASIRTNPCQSFWTICFMDWKCLAIRVQRTGQSKVKWYTNEFGCIYIWRNSPRWLVCDAVFDFAQLPQYCWVLCVMTFCWPLLKLIQHQTPRERYLNIPLLKWILPSFSIKSSLNCINKRIKNWTLKATQFIKKIRKKSMKMSKFMILRSEFSLCNGIIRWFTFAASAMFFSKIEFISICYTRSIHFRL